MKGVFIHQQVEYRIEVPKEGFEQGDTLDCTLTVKNHSAAKVVVADLRLELACGDVKAVRERKEDCFDPIGQAELGLPWELAALQQRSSQWTFTLDKNCTISDKAETLYLLFGPRTVSLGQLPLQVHPHPHIQAAINLLEPTFQFVLKSVKSNKGWVEAKLKPSTSRRFATLDQLLLGFRLGEGSLQMRYVFKEKKFDTSGSSSGALKQGKTEVAKEIEESRYIMPGGFINSAALEGCIDEALETVASKI